jgi:hypothetical protein
MFKHIQTRVSILILGILICTFIVSCSTGNTSAGTGGQSLMQDRCSVCHSITRISSAHKTAAEWTTTVQRMVSLGAQLNQQEQQTLIDYLTATYK